MKSSRLFNMVIGGIVTLALLFGGYGAYQWLQKEKILRQVIERLSADTRAAEVLVTKSEYDEDTQKIKTTIKFLEYDANGQPLVPNYFSFNGNIIQFQSLVIRFPDQLVQIGDRLRGKSAHLFMKAFVLDGANTQEFVITKIDEVPAGYRIEGNEGQDEFQKELWENFWSYALDPEEREHAGVKNAQIEAPGSMFLPGTIYTLHIEHDGGLRIDTKPVPEILRGEKVESAKK